MRRVTCIWSGEMRRKIQSVPTAGMDMMLAARFFLTSTNLSFFSVLVEFVCAFSYLPQFCSFIRNFWPFFRPVFFFLISLPLSLFVSFYHLLLLFVCTVEPRYSAPAFNEFRVIAHDFKSPIFFFFISL